MKKLVLVIAMLLLTSCGNGLHTDPPGPTPPAPPAPPAPKKISGTYKQSPCFLNKLASEGAGTDVSTQVYLSLHEDGTGLEAVGLWIGAGCGGGTNPPDEQVAILFTWSEVKSFGDVRIIKLSLEGVGDVYGAMKVEDNGLYFDSDYTDGHSGPYQVEPDLSADGLQDFINDPTSGMFIERY